MFIANDIFFLQTELKTVKRSEIDLEKRLFGGAFTLLLAIVCMEMRSLKDKVNFLELRLEQHIEAYEEISDYCDKLKFRFSDHCI